MERLLTNKILLIILGVCIGFCPVVSADIITDDSLITADVTDEPDTEPPQVTITAPEDASTLSGTILIEVTVTDNRGSLPYYQLFINSLEVSNSFPYRWDTVSYGDGYYVIRADATDMSDNLGSDEISVNVETRLEQNDFFDDFQTFNDLNWLIPFNDLPDNGQLVDWNDLSQYMVLLGTGVDLRSHLYTNFVYNRDVEPIFKTDFLFDASANGFRITAEGWTHLMAYRMHGVILQAGQIFAIWNDGTEQISFDPIVLSPAAGTWYTMEIEFTDTDSRLFCYEKDTVKPLDPSHVFDFDGWHPRFHFWNMAGQGCVDNVAVTATTVPMQGSISGYVDLQGRIDHTALVTFELRIPGTTVPISTYQPVNDEDPGTPGTQITLDSSGDYTLIGIPEGTYDLAVKGPLHLRAKEADVSVMAGLVSSVNFHLKGGDGNNDNSVGTGDMLILQAAWLSSAGDPNWDERADFNGDGSVGTSDMLILQANWLQTGEE